jgi:hypothetical protein
VERLDARVELGQRRLDRVPSGSFDIRIVGSLAALRGA